VSSPPNTTVLNFSYTSGSRQQAAVVANALANAYLIERQAQAASVADSQSRSLQRSIDALDARRVDTGRRLGQAGNLTVQDALTAELTQINGALRELETRRAQLEALDTTSGSLVKPAVPTSKPDGPSVPILLLAGALLGAMSAFAISLAWGRLSDRIYSVEDLAGTEGIGMVVELPKGGGRAAIEAWRVLAVRLAHQGVGAKWRRLVVTSPEGEADALAASRLADALSDAGVQARAVSNWIEASPQQVSVYRAPMSGGARALRSMDQAEAAILLVAHRRRLPEVTRVVEVLSEAGVTVLATGLLITRRGGGGPDGERRTASEPRTARIPLSKMRGSVGASTG
jgi:hypothetical protein